MRSNIQHRHSLAQKTAHEGALGEFENSVHLGPTHVVVPRQKPATERQGNRQRHSRKYSPHSQANGKIFFPCGHRCESLHAEDKLVDQAWDFPRSASHSLYFTRTKVKFSSCP